MSIKDLKSIFKNYGSIIRFQTIFLIINLLIIFSLPIKTILLVLFSLAFLAFAAAAIIFYYKVEKKEKIEIKFVDFLIIFGLLFISALFSIILFLIGYFLVKINTQLITFEIILSIIILSDVISILIFSYLPAYYLTQKDVVKSFRKVLSISNFKNSVQYANISLLFILIPTILFLKAALTWPENVLKLYFIYILTMSYIFVPLNYIYYWKVFLGEKE